MAVKKLSYYGAVLLTMGVLLGTQIGSYFSDGDAYSSFKKIEDTFLLIKRNYVEDVDSAQLTQAGIEQMLSRLDPHSVYISRERMERVQESFDASFEGIGISYELVGGENGQDTVTVLSAIPGGPSDEAGLVSGDRIVEVDDSSAIGFTHEDVQRTLKGPKGTTVDVAVRRPGMDELIPFTITRDEIPLHTVDASYMVDDRTGYIKINRFASTTYAEFMRAMRGLERQGMDRLMLDLRGNAGGFMNMAVRIADEFLPEDQVIVSARSRHREYNQINRARSGGSFEEEPVMVLVDEHSASASEIVAGALQDHDRALIIGRRSFGKGLVQKQFDLSDGSAMRVTISRFYTPSGRLIQTPYQTGDRDTYYREKEQRALNRTNVADPTEFLKQVPDSLKYSTDHGRTVVGGGGILPDFIVPADTLSPFLKAVSGQGLVSSFVRSWYDTHRQGLREEWAEQADYVHDFSVQEPMRDAFMSYVRERGVSIGEDGRFRREEVTRDQRRIDTLLKAHLARRLFGQEAWYPIYSQIDPVFREARLHWNDAERLARL